MGTLEILRSFIAGVITALVLFIIGVAAFGTFSMDLLTPVVNSAEWIIVGAVLLYIGLALADNLVKLG